MAISDVGIISWYKLVSAFWLYSDRMVWHAPVAIHASELLLLVDVAFCESTIAQYIRLCKLALTDKSKYFSYPAFIILVFECSTQKDDASILTNDPQ